MEDYSQLSVNQRIKILIKNKYFTGVKLSELVGVHPSTVSEHLSKDADLPTKYLIEISREFPNISTEWILLGTGEIEKTVVQEYIKKGDLKREMQRIPLYSFEARAGLVKLFNESQNILDFITIPNLPKCDGAIHISGDSMYPLLKSGDIVMYKIIYDMRYGIFYGEMYLVSVDIDDENYTLVKYIHRGTEANHIKLVSQNSNHEAFEIPLEKVKGLALIKASIRVNRMD